MKDLTPTELNTLYGNFVVYRDKYCKGHAQMDIKTFFSKFGLNEYRHPEDVFNDSLNGCLYGTYGGY